MSRADWMAAERAFNRREPLEDERMGRGRWSKRSVGGAESHTLEFGFKYMFSVRAGPKSDGMTPDVWWASSRDGALGDFPSVEAAKKACEDEARRLIEASATGDVVDFDAKTVQEQWEAYMANPKRLQSTKTISRYK